MHFMKALFANSGCELRPYQHNSMICRFPKPSSNEHSQTAIANLHGWNYSS